MWASVVVLLCQTYCLAYFGVVDTELSASSINSTSRMSKTRFYLVLLNTTGHDTKIVAK